MKLVITSQLSISGHKTASILWRLKVALANPSLAVSYLRRQSHLAKLTRLSIREVRSYFAEPALLSALTLVQEQLSPFREQGLGFCGRSPELYVLTRILKPNIVVETGVANGVSSTLILRALEENGNGKLVSIDLPNLDLGSVLALGKKTGWMVPTELRARWSLILGRSLDLLPNLLKELKTIDIFLHDSDHSYEYMKDELEIAWQFLNNQGILLADDAWDNSAFKDFAIQVKRPAIMIANMGAIRK